MFGIGKLWGRWKLYRKFAPLLTIIENAFRSGDMKKAIGSRKLRMGLLAQVMFTGTTVLLAWFGVR